MNCPDCPSCYKYLLEISTRPPLLRPQPVPNSWPIRRYYWEELTNESTIPYVQACLVCNQQWGCLSMYRIPNKIISFAGNIPEKKRITTCPRIIERYIKYIRSQDLQRSTFYYLPLGKWALIFYLFDWTIRIGFWFIFCTNKA